jgi:Flp pilus assembly pilin Flp
MMDRINTFVVATYTRLQREEGQATLEYALVLVAIVGLVAAAAFGGLGTSIQNKFTHLLDTATP